MKNYGNAQKHGAAGVGLILAVIFIIACNAAEPSRVLGNAELLSATEPADSSSTLPPPDTPAPAATAAALVNISAVATPTQLPPAATLTQPPNRRFRPRRLPPFR